MDTSDELLAKARLANIRRHIRAGWALVDGMLKRGAISKKPTALTPYPEPWEVGYNPMLHSVGIRMGGEYVAPGVYRLKSTGLLVDDNGSLLDQDACVGCGTRRDTYTRKVIGADYRWTVRAQSQNPFAPRWLQAWSYCRKCVTSEELASHRAWQDRERMKAEAEAMRQNGRR